MVQETHLMNRKLLPDYTPIDEFFGCVPQGLRPRLTAEEKEQIALEHTPEESHRIIEIMKKELGLREDQIIR